MVEQAVIEVLDKEKPVYEREATALTINDDSGAQSATLFIAKCREAEKRLEAERRSQTDPLNDRIAIITKPYKESIGWFERLRTGMDAKLQDYRRRVALAQQQEQARLLADKRKREDEAAAELKREQEKLAQQQALLQERTSVPTAREDKALAKQEAKVEEARAALTEVAQAPVAVVEQQAKSTRLDDGSMVTSRTKKGWVFTAGIPKGTVLDRTDARIADLPDTYFVLDEKRINAAVKAGMVPPGITIVDESSSVVRSAK